MIPSPLPKEIEVVGDPGARIEVIAEALPAGGGAPIIARLASARVPASSGDASEKKLVRVYLESRCVVLPTLPPPPGQIADKLLCPDGTDACNTP